MNSSTSWSFNLDSVHLWAYLENVFTSDECKKIIEIGENKNVSKGVVRGELQDVRDSYVSWLFPEENTRWIYERLSNSVMVLNNQFFNFHLSGFLEGLQFTRYDAPSGFYGVHTDRAFNQAVRKLSVSIQLSNPNSYEGGELGLQDGSNVEVMGKEQGKLIAFPSFVLHQVKPVTKGTRYSLVAWVSGDPFR
jgi:PKHD-type hydroxylase